MDQEETSMSQPQAPKAEPMAAPNEAELSRIAREAVHQPADPRLDRQLARMGVMESAGPAAGSSSKAVSPPVVSSAEVELLGARIRRLETIAGVLGVAVVVLAVIAVILLVR
jgi:uncharacterized membrane protein